MFNAVKKLFQVQSTVDYSTVQDVQQNRTLVHTPDIMPLEQNEHHLMFIYCDRQTNHPGAVPGEHLWDAFTDKTYLFWKHDLGKLSYPIALNHLPEFKRLHKLPIRGEVVKMRTSEVVKLDQVKSNRVQFRRVRVPLKVHVHSMVETKERCRLEEMHGIPHVSGDKYPIPCYYEVEAWMYVGVAKYWTPLIDDGYIFPTGQIIEPKNKKNAKYYFFPSTSYT